MRLRIKSQMNPMKNHLARDFFKSSFMYRVPSTIFNLVTEIYVSLYPNIKSLSAPHLIGDWRISTSQQQKVKKRTINVGFAQIKDEY